MESKGLQDSPWFAGAAGSFALSDSAVSVGCSLGLAGISIKTSAFLDQNKCF
jgi:hypothetical protein